MRTGRRGFLIGVASVAGAVALDLRFPGAARAEEKSAAPAGRPLAWLVFGAAGKITLRVLSSDIGQGAQTGLAQCVAEELDLDPSALTVEMAPVEPDYFIRDFLGKKGYFTGGSSSIRSDFTPFRALGATARRMLVAAAAARWNIRPDQCATKNAFVTNSATRARLHYGVLAPALASMPVPGDVALKPRAAWTVIGQPVPRGDLPGKVKGATVYGIDFQERGLLSAALMQCPAFKGTLQSVDPAPAMAVPGVVQVVRLPDAVAVVARRYWQARKALALLKPKWGPSPAAAASSESLNAAMAAAFGRTDGRVLGDAERVNAVFSGVPAKVEAEYHVPFLHHAALEPMNATASFTGESVELWAPMQNQSGMRQAVASALGLAEEKVILHTLPSGGGFGRRLQADYGVYAALVSRAVTAPVKVIWSREEDFSHGYYRPAAMARLSAALTGEGRLKAIRIESAAVNTRLEEGLEGLPYDDLALHGVLHGVRSPVPTGPWRAVGYTQNIFFVESLVDEAALAAGRDPLAFRRDHLKGDHRLLKLLDAAATAIGYGKPPTGRAHGVALMRGWNTRVVEIAEVSKDADGRPRVHKVVCALDCGFAVNPDAVRAQAEGGIVMGLSAALGETIRIAGGQTVEKNYDQYDLLRMDSAPEIEVIVLDEPDAEPGGAGEPPLAPVAPALANAWAKLTGERVRALPLIPPA